MAQKPAELTNDNIDPIARAAGAGDASDPFIEKYGSDQSPTNQENLAATGDDSEETEQIKAQIEETRNQLGGTIDAIQERLSLANVSEQVSEQVSNAIESAKDTVYDATIGKAVYYMKNFSNDISTSNAFRTVRNNPFPLVLIGLGAGLLAYQSFGRTSGGRRPIRGLGRFDTSGETERYTQHSDRRHETESSKSTTSSGSLGNVSDKANKAYAAVSDAAGSAYESVSGTVSSAYSGVGEAFNRAYQSAGEVGTRAQERYEYHIDQNPLAVGAVAAALGTAVGLAIPSTRYESRLLGETRQNLLDKAQGAAGDLIDRAKTVAEEAGKTIQQEVKANTN